MLLHSEGIVLNSIKYGESSQISKILSKEKGLITVISSRSKTKKNRQANYFQPLSAILFICYGSNKSTIYRIKEVGYNASINSYIEDTSLNAIRFFLAEFLSKVIQEEEQNFTLYKFVESELKNLFLINSELGFFHIQFLLKLCNEIGISPDISTDGAYFDLTEGSTVLTKPSHVDFYDGEAKILLLKALNGHDVFTKNQRSVLLNLLIDYYNVQLGGGFQNLKTKKILEVIFS